MNKKILGAILPGNSTVELKEFDMPKPGYGQVVVKTKASTVSAPFYHGTNNEDKNACIPQGIQAFVAPTGVKTF